MTSTADISVLYQEFTEALTEVLAENSVGPARRGRLARARAAVKKHPKYSEHEYFIAVETAFQKWEAIQGRKNTLRGWPSTPLSRRVTRALAVRISNPRRTFIENGKGGTIG